MENIIKHYIDKLLHHNADIEPIEQSDCEIFRHFFQNDTIDYSYASSWFYLTKAANLVGIYDVCRYGLKFIKPDECFMTLSLFRSPFSKQLHFHIINPLSIKKIDKSQNDLSDQIVLLCEDLYDLIKTPVYLKKVNFELIDRLKMKPYFHVLTSNSGAQNHKKYWWHKTAKIEDDTFPERILDIENTLSYLEKPGENQIKDKYRRFKNANKSKSIIWEDMNSSNADDAKAIVFEFFKQTREGDINISTPNDYMNMIESDPGGNINKDYFKKIVYVDNEPLALVITEQTNRTNCHGLFSNVSLYRKCKWLSEYVIIEILKSLKENGVKYLNLGGSETEGLDKFKQKFQPKLKRLSPWLVFDRG